MQEKRFEFPANRVKGLESQNASVASTTGFDNEKVIVTVPASVQLTRDPYLNSRGVLTIIGRRGGGDIFAGVNLIQAGSIQGDTPSGMIRIERPADHKMPFGIRNSFS